MSHRFKYPGVAVTLLGKVHYIPSITLAGFIRHCDVLTGGVDELPPAERIPRLMPVALEAIQQNYPEFTEEELGSLDLYSFRLLMKAIQNASGVEYVTPGE